jgi:hypothetical protein
MSNRRRRGHDPRLSFAFWNAGVAVSPLFRGLGEKGFTTHIFFTTKSCRGRSTEIKDLAAILIPQICQQI